MNLHADFINRPSFHPLAKCASRFALTALALLQPATGSPALLHPWPVGMVATSHVVTPVPLIVVDPLETETRRQQEAQRTPAVFRHDAQVAAQSEASLRRAFAEMRETFVAALESRFGRRFVEIDEVTDARFGFALEQCRQASPRFPFSDELVRLWGLGASGEIVLEQWLAQFKPVSAQFILPGSLPPAARSGPGSVRILPQAGAALEKRGRSVPRTNLLNLARLQRDAEKIFPTLDPAAARYLAGWLTNNCAFDETLTHDNRAAHTNSLWAADNYSAGQTLVRRGDVVTPKIKLALDELASRQHSGASSAPTAAPRHSRRWINGLVLAALAGVLIAFALWKRKSRRSPIGGATKSGALEVISPDADETSWKERALAAEARAGRLDHAMRAGLIPHVARWLSDHFLRGLVSERNSLLTARQSAEEEMAQIEARLAALQAPLAARLEAYEARISELERELQAKGEENHDLLQAKIQLTRQKLASERAHRPETWN